VNWLVVGALLPSLLVAWSAGYVVRWKAARWGFLDRPGGHKGHQRATPLGGGLAIWLAVVGVFAVGQLVLWGLDRGILSVDAMPTVVQTHWQGLLFRSAKLWTLLAAASVMMALGLVDDLRGLPWQLRLAVQVLVAVVVVCQGWRLALFLDLPWLTGLLSVLWIVGLTNTFNMLDNMDGLAAGVAAIAALVLAAVLLIAPDPESHAPQLFAAGFLLVLAGSLLGFLWHNRSPARLFMGDAGSYFIGFCLAMATLAGTFAGGSLPRHAILAPLCALAVPLYDTATVVLIRLGQGRSPFAADRNHFSHRLVQLGLSCTAAVWTIYLATATCGLGALLLHQVDAVGAVVVLLLIGCVLLLIAILETAGRRE
jgi:UDP-GlcNAc:undecaprenyl-phosphate GlcNAc-1-phosphate transferase